jgi:hypothetical protein
MASSEPPADDHRPAGPAEEPAPGGDGLRWSFELDVDAVFAAMGRSQPAWDDIDQDEDLADELAARDRDGGAPSRDAAGAVAGALPAGPGLAAWLSGLDPAAASGRDLITVAAAFRRVAAWAQAGELAAVAEVAARSAAADPKAGLRPDGSPACVTDDAAAQVSLGLTLSHYGAEAWTGLSVALRWRLPRTAAALATGQIDLLRARILAEAVVPLTDAAARAVEDAVLPRAADLTYTQLSAATRRAVIAADPEGAEHRRQSAERRAKVSLYADQDCTATLTGTRLPAALATAAMARLSAMARALRASGAGGGLDLLRAQIYVGLLLGTMPTIPPRADGPPDADPPPADADPPGTDQAPADPDDGTRPAADPRPRDGRPGEPGGADAPDAGPGRGRRSSRPAGPGGSGGGLGGRLRPRRGSPAGDEAGTGRSSADAPGGGMPRDGMPRDCMPPDGMPDDSVPADSVPDDGTSAPWLDAPPLSDADMPEDDGYRDKSPPGGYADGDPDRGDPLDDHFSAASDPVPAWPPAPCVVPAWPNAGPCDARGRPPPGGLLDLTLAWATLAGESDRPGTLGRIGPVTAWQTRDLVRLALGDYRTEWRVIVVDAAGSTISVGRVPRLRPPPGSAGAGLTGVVGRVTVAMPAADLDRLARPGQRPAGRLPSRLVAAGTRALARARVLAQADRGAAGGCAHATASAAYRPPPRLREHVIARDQTCRYPFCGQPAWRGDLDHTHPWEAGGKTCRCNLGGLCRRHHRLKQRAGWRLIQPQPGTFLWITPAGLTYRVQPEAQAA